MSDLIRIKRGLKNQLPQLMQGEMGFCTDTQELFIGGVNGNVKLNITYYPVLRDLSYLFQQDGIKTVITGDSLSFNAIGFDPSHIVNAYESKAGIGSWSFMLRDAIWRNDRFFIHGDEIMFRNERQDTEIAASYGEPYLYPFNNRYLHINTYAGTEKISFPYKHDNNTNKAVLYIGGNPTNTACAFGVYVNGVFLKTVDNDGRNRQYQGLEPIIVEIPNIFAGQTYEISLRDFTQTALAPDATGRRSIQILGIGSKYSPVYFTGQGGQTANWLMNNVESRINNHNPDVVMIVIGANDRVSRTVDQFYSDLETIVTTIRAKNKQCEIVFMSPPTSQNKDNPELDNELYIPDWRTRLYAEKMKMISDTYSCTFIDLMDVFNGVPISEWRHDNVHFTRVGNTILSRSIVNMLLPQGLHPKDMIDSSLSWNNLQSAKDVQTVHGWARIEWDGAKYNIVGQSKEKAVRSVEKVNDYTVKVNFNYGVGYGQSRQGFIYGVSATQFGGISNPLQTRTFEYGLESASFVTLKNGELTTAGDYSTTQDFQFQVTF